VEDEKSIEKAVKSRCPHFYELLPVMGDRATAVPLATENELELNEANAKKEESSSEEDSFYGSMLKGCNYESDDKKVAAVTATGSKRSEVLPLSVRFPKKQKGNSITDKISGDLFQLKQAELDFQKEKYTYQQEFDEMNSLLKMKEASRKEKMDEINAEILNESLKAAKLQNKVALLKARKELLDQGVSEEEVNKLLSID
jgi:hypothetical protein